MNTTRPCTSKKSAASYAPKVIAIRGAIQTSLFLCLALALSGCGHIGYKPRGFDIPPVKVSAENANKSGDQPRKIVIFFDGTANDEGSDTNVKRLHSLITLQDRKDIASLYILGVGTNVDPIGLAMGSGINARVTLAYEFILNHYQHKTADMKADEIYIFGFSRGAFAARILTTMLHYAGIVKETGTPDKTRHTVLIPWSADDCAVKQVAKPSTQRRFTPKELSELVHSATFPGFNCGDADHYQDRSRYLKASLAINDLESVVGADNSISIPVKVLGLWDTVEALGSPRVVKNLMIPFRSTPPVTNVDDPNLRYGEKLCNVEVAYHAMSIDDNRATIFTPLLLSRQHLFVGCPNGKGLLDAARKIKQGSLQEVWFSGAHSDVGGGYANGALSGVSLNWMLNRIKCKGLLSNVVCPAGNDESADAPFVREDFFGGSHDPTAGLWGFYPKVSRDLVTYALDEKSIWSEKSASPKSASAIPDPPQSAPLCVHESVFERRRLIGQSDNDYDQLFLNVKPEGTGQTAIVKLVYGNYGKGRSWQWLRQLKPQETATVKSRLEIQSYPKCSFMQAATVIQSDPLGKN